MYILWRPWNINNWLGTHPVWGRPLLTNIYNALVQCNLPLYRVWQKCVKETDFRFTRYSKNVLHQPLTIKCIVLLSILSTYLLYNLFTLNWFHNLQHCSDLIKSSTLFRFDQEVFFISKTWSTIWYHRTYRTK